MLRLSIIRRHYEMGFKSIVGLIEQLEDQIETLTLSQISSSAVRLQTTVITQQNEIKNLTRTVENKSQQLIQSQQLNHELQKRIRELENCLAGNDESQIRKDSHNSNLPPALDLPGGNPNEPAAYAGSQDCRSAGSGVTRARLYDRFPIRVRLLFIRLINAGTAIYPLKKLS